MSLENSPVNFAQPNDVTGRNSDTNNYMPGSEHAGLSPAIVESIAGLSAGTIATLVVHPLDIVKTRMQSKIQMILFYLFSFFLLLVGF
jgi:solute carrier family 25 folate transporter 32